MRVTRETLDPQSMEFVSTTVLQRGAPEPKRLWEVAGAGHVDLCDFAPEEYQARVLDFFGATLR